MAKGPARRTTAGRGIPVHTSASIQDSLPNLSNLGQKTGVVPVTIKTNPYPSLKGFNASVGSGYTQPLSGDVIR